MVILNKLVVVVGLVDLHNFVLIYFNMNKTPPKTKNIKKKGKFVGRKTAIFKWPCLKRFRPSFNDNKFYATRNGGTSK